MIHDYISWYIIMYHDIWSCIMIPGHVPWCMTMYPDTWSHDMPHDHVSWFTIMHRHIWSCVTRRRKWYKYSAPNCNKIWLPAHITNVGGIYSCTTSTVCNPRSAVPWPSQLNPLSPSHQCWRRYAPGAKLKMMWCRTALRHPSCCQHWRGGKGAACNNAIASIMGSTAFYSSDGSPDIVKHCANWLCGISCDHVSGYMVMHHGACPGIIVHDHMSWYMIMYQDV